VLVPRQALRELGSLLPKTSAGLRVVSVEVDIDPLDLVRSGGSSAGFAGFYGSPDGRAIGGLGVAHRVGASGPDRLSVLDEGITGLDAATPIMVGFAFDDHGPAGPAWDGFGAASAVVPEVSVIRVGGRSQLTLALPPGSDGRSLVGLVGSLRSPSPANPVRATTLTVESRPSPGDWVGLVGEAVQAIRSGALDKVVLARTVVVTTSSFLEPFELVAHLRDRHPGARVFGWQEGGSTFLGASPEMLVARQGSHVLLEPLAGSAARGSDPEEDRRFGDLLLASAKDRREHAIVVDDALARIEHLIGSVSRSAEARLRRFRDVQHLATTISGSTDARLLTLATALHPTPAVGGAPRQAALGLIDKLEGLDRGWYSGGIGWADPSGDGEIALGLRCALVSGERAILFAGSGIVGDSEPASELDETRLKLRPMMELLTPV
jgi:menaquinone-specific isochorismate synthase